MPTQPVDESASTRCSIPAVKQSTFGPFEERRNYGTTEGSWSSSLLGTFLNARMLVEGCNFGIFKRGSNILLFIQIQWNAMLLLFPQKHA